MKATTVWRVVYSSVVFISLIALALWFTSPVRPIKWLPSASDGLDTKFTPTSHFSNSLLLEGLGKGPEDILISDDGYLYTAYDDGRIIKVPVSSIMEKLQDAKIGARLNVAHSLVVNTGGRPLGLKFDAANNLIVADAVKGLLSIDTGGTITVLADEHEGQKLKFVDHLAIDKQGRIWFSDASSRFDYHNYVYDFIEASATGRLMSYNPISKKTSVHISGLFFANGVTISPKNDFVLINETGRSRIHRYWLSGDKKGSSDIFIENLPAMPDNIYTKDDTIWVAMVALRDPKVEALAQYPFLRRLLGGLPRLFLQASSDYAFVLGLNENAEVLHSLQSDEGYQVITAVVEHEGHLFLGSLQNNAIAVTPLQ
ncbi:strictosidine synthase family protein [Glaciecola sp. MH2013]|uniref:SMP-30/gluconolactonase/LRE family protein n=1 Tax=Glaciecola sp. MH2013 TaxID=2785524 RepID=UPI00189EE189|nr:SMP-30/gluconolactonase/LRE family protein [Glaciecola sp. MH2013]MBF7073080.1 strictosidine synthase family protein [Glaciecola sp. MH2013]